jgi:hypothetical protein
LGWIYLLPFSQTLHLRLADHDHRYCPIHDQIEDVFDVHEIAARIPSYDSVAASASRTGRHIPCSVLNADTVNESLIARSEHGRQRFKDECRKKIRCPAYPPRFVDLVLIAPKHSPPST